MASHDLDRVGQYEGNLRRVERGHAELLQFGVVVHVVHVEAVPADVVERDDTGVPQVLGSRRKSSPAMCWPVVARGASGSRE